MSDYKEKVTTTNDDTTDPRAQRVQQKTREVETEESADGKSLTTNIIWYIVGFVEVLLAFRFALKLFGANSSSGFVDFIYSVTGVLTAPFDSIFGVSTNKTGDVQSVFEPSILVAAAVYALIGWGIVKLLDVNRAK